MTSFTGIILAGGKGSRLGLEKAFLEIGGKSIIEIVIDALDLCDEIIISANDANRFKNLPARIVPDEPRSGGALVGLYSSLKAAKNDLAIVVACDMPFLSKSFIRHIMQLPVNYDALVPSFGGYIEPLHSIYSKRCLDSIVKHIKAGHRQLRSFYDEVNIEYVEEDVVKEFSSDGLIFFNINTAQDLEKARGIVSNGRISR